MNRPVEKNATELQFLLHSFRVPGLVRETGIGLAAY
jgi:hypothetical protein